MLDAAHQTHNTYKAAPTGKNVERLVHWGMRERALNCFCKGELDVVGNGPALAALSRAGGRVIGG